MAYARMDVEIGAESAATTTKMKNKNVDPNLWDTEQWLNLFDIF